MPAPFTQPEKHQIKAIGFNRPLPISDENSLLDIELPAPELRERDLLVEVRAVSVNPADVKVRAAHTPAAPSASSTNCLAKRWKKCRAAASKP